MKITLPQLINLLSLSSGKPRQQCEDFLREFFQLAEEVLESGENVRIKGFGTFKLIEVSARKSVNVSNGEEHEIPARSKIVFVASKELAAIVNQPFEAFEAVEITDDSLEEWKEMEGDAGAGNDSEESYDSDSRDNSDYQYEETISEDVDLSDDDNDDSDTVIYMTVDEELSDKAEVAEKEPEIEDRNLLYEVTVDDEIEEPVDGADEKTILEPTIDADEESDKAVEENNSLDDDSDTDDSRIPKFSHEESDESQSVRSEMISLLSYGDDSCEDDEEGTGESGRILREKSEIRKKRKKYKFAWGFFAGFIACVAVVTIVLSMLGYMLDFSRTGKKSMNIDNEGDNQEITEVIDNNVQDNGKDSETVINSDDESEEGIMADTQPSDEIVYDIVTTTHYLTTIAKEHYGNYNLWPYIYEENKSILGHPDRIRPGTKVVVPPLSKYGVDPENPEDIAVAKKKGMEIYAKYKK